MINDMTPNNRQRLIWAKYNHVHWLSKSATVLTHKSYASKMAAIFVDDIFRCIFVYENRCILIQISLKFARKGQINNTPGLVTIMTWYQVGIFEILHLKMLFAKCPPFCLDINVLTRLDVKDARESFFFTHCQNRGLYFWILIWHFVVCECIRIISMA